MNCRLIRVYLLCFLPGLVLFCEKVTGEEERKAPGLVSLGLTLLWGRD